MDRNDTLAQQLARREMNEHRWRQRVERAVGHKHTPEIEWEREWDQDLTPEATALILNDTLADEEIEGRIEDVGIGAYEYWGFRGVDSRIAHTAEATTVVIRLKGVDHEVPLFDEPIKLNYSGGGCDGEHPGRCRACCAEWEVAFAWKAVFQELRGSDLYVVCEGEQV